MQGIGIPRHRKKKRTLVSLSRAVRSLRRGGGALPLHAVSRAPASRSGERALLSPQRAGRTHRRPLLTAARPHRAQHEAPQLQQHGGQGAELNQEKRTYTFRSQVEEESCRLVLNAVGARLRMLRSQQICLGEKAKEEVNRVEILTTTTQEDRKTPSITIATLKPSVLPMVAMAGVSLSPPVTFQLRAGSGPVFLSGQECYESSDAAWEEEEDEAEEEEEEEEEEDDDEADVSIEDTPTKQVKRPVPQKRTSAAKKKKVEREDEEAARCSAPYKTPLKKGKSSERPRKLEAKRKGASDTP
ncbi:nucleoplasmin-2 [Erethizon dorsatum]